LQKSQIALKYIRIVELTASKGKERLIIPNEYGEYDAQYKSYLG